MLNQRDLCVDKGSRWTGTASVSMKNKIVIMLFPSPVFKYGISLVLPGTHECRCSASVAITPKMLQCFRSIWCFQDLSVHTSIVMCGKNRDVIKDATVQRPARPFFDDIQPHKDWAFYRFEYSPAINRQSGVFVLHVFSLYCPCHWHLNRIT